MKADKHESYSRYLSDQKSNTYFLLHTLKGESELLLK